MKKNKDKIIVILVCVLFLLVGFLGGNFISFSLNNDISIKNNVDIENNVNIENDVNIHNDVNVGNEIIDNDLEENDNSDEGQQEDFLLCMLEDFEGFVLNNSYLWILVPLFVVSCSFNIFFRLYR